MRNEELPRFVEESVEERI